MATAEDLLKKSESRRKNILKSFQPEKRRSWDYINQNSSFESNIKQEENGNKYGNKNNNNSEQNSNINKDENNNNSEQIWEQNSNKYKNEYRISLNDKTKVNIEQKIFTESENINPKTEKNIINVLRKTTGYQQKIMEQITAHIKSMKDIVNIINIPISSLSVRISADKNTTRTSIKRLQKKSILLKSPGERGRHGCTQVVILNFVIKECLNLFHCEPSSLDELIYINRNKNRNNNLLHSSSNNITTTENMELSLSGDWVEINIEPLKDIGFSLTQLKQLQLKSLNTPKIIQESIDHFSFGLEYNPKVKQYSDPLNVLMGVLRKGQAWIEQNYRSPQEIAQERFLVQKKAERERFKKLEEEAYKFALEEWCDSLSAEKIEEIAPSKKSEMDITPQNVKLSLYFKSTIWPQKKIEYLVTDEKNTNST